MSFLPPSDRVCGYYSVQMGTVLGRTLLCCTLLAGLIAACGAASDDEEGNAACRQYVDKLRECGLLGEGRTPCAGSATEVSLCVADCFQNASCDQVRESVCDQTPPALSACRISCGEAFFTNSSTPAPAFQQVTCGDNTTFGTRCNGFNECADGSDEANCAMFSCESGKMILEYQVCDQLIDCFNGSDETCRPLFHCDNGGALEPEDECDGVAQCTDGSDEKNCFTCGAETFPPSVECNGNVDCSNAADELGCAQVTCSTATAAP